MSSEMIERVARAIDPDAYVAAGFHGGADAWTAAKTRARAAIAAMREPPAGLIKNYAGPGGEAEYGLEKYRAEFIETAWRAMIDAVLADAR